MEINRLRALRNSPEIRELVAQTRVSPKDLIMPCFVIEGKNDMPISSMPGISRLSVDSLIREAREIKENGIKAILLFGACRKKSKEGENAYSRTGIIQRAIGMLKKYVKDLVVITDVCLCSYTSSGHCGIVKNGAVDNDTTIKILAKIALSHARAGADFIAPSAMMDGQVGAIRGILNKNEYKTTGIFAYSAKYASNFYGPFRDALNSSPRSGDRKTYQMDFRNSNEALAEIQQDILEGADVVMVKPALAYLDIIRRAKDSFDKPIAAYNVSGEYSLVKSGDKAGVIKQKDAVLEILTAIKRAGADLIITYHAKEAAKWLT